MLAGIYKHRAPTERFQSQLTEIIRKSASPLSNQILFVATRKERATFADGTIMTVDWNSNSFSINPELN